MVGVVAYRTDLSVVWSLGGGIVVAMAAEVGVVAMATVVAATATVVAAAMEMEWDLKLKAHGAVLLEVVAEEEEEEDLAAAAVVAMVATVAAMVIAQGLAMHAEAAAWVGEVALL